MAVLTPRLTGVDRRVLARLPGPGESAKRLIDCFRAPDDTPLCPRHGRCYAKDRECPGCVRALDHIADRFEEFAEIARGLERTGYARQAGGWWRRTS